MISIEGLSKRFGEFTAVDRVELSANKGEIVGFLGPNGAGKTTTLRMLYGLMSPSAGSIYVDGMDIQRKRIDVQKKLGVLADNSGLYERLSARENIRYFGRLHGLSKHDIDKRIDDFLDILNMHSIIGRPVKGFSQGERVKVNLLRALIHNPDYILLDEPTNGLDVSTTIAVRNLLKHLKEMGKCIVFSSHLMYEVENLCDRIYVIAKGRIVAQGSINAVLQQFDVPDLEQAFIRLTAREHV